MCYIMAKGFRGSFTLEPNWLELIRVGVWQENTDSGQTEPYLAFWL